MTIEEFQKLLDNFDWAYQYSDDYRVWETNDRKHQELRNMALAFGGEFLAAYKKKNGDSIDN